MSNSRKVAYNTAIQVIGRVVGLLISLITVNYVANHLLSNGSVLIGYGQYTIVFTYISVLAAVADLGLYTLIVREITGKNPDEAGSLIGSALVFRGLLMTLFALLFVALFHSLPYDQVVREGILIGVVVTASMLFSQTVESIFQASLQADRIVIVETVGKIVIAGLTILVLHQGRGLIAVVTVNLIGQLVTLGLSFLLARPMVRIKLHFDNELWKKNSAQFWSIAIVNVLALVHFKSDALLLTFFKGAADVGIYGIAYKIFEIVLIVPSIFATNLLPTLTGVLSEGSRQEAGRIINRSSSVLFTIAAFLSVFVLGFAPWIIVFIAQPAFLAAATPLRILTLPIFFIFLTTLISQAIIAGKEQQILVRGYVFVIVLNISLNLYAIPRFSYLGAAVTTGITEACLLGYTLWVGQKNFGSIINWKSLGRILAAAILSLIGLGLVAQTGGIDLNSFIGLGRLSQALLLLGGLLITGFIYYLSLMIVSLGSSTKRVTGFSK